MRLLNYTQSLILLIYSHEAGKEWGEDPTDLLSSAERLTRSCSVGKKAGKKVPLLWLSFWYPVSEDNLGRTLLEQNGEAPWEPVF